MDIVENGFYIVKDEFFKEFSDKYLKTNKAGNRPHYFAYRDHKTNLLWLIPMSSQVQKYQMIIDKRLSANKPCDTLHIAELDNGKTNVFLIQDMFPITDKYIEREYTINGNHLVLSSERQIKIITQKAKKILHLIESGTQFMPTQPNVLKIKEKLLNHPL